MEHLRLFVAHRSAGLRLPLRDTDVVELFDASHALVGSLTGDTLRRLVLHHLTSALLAAAVAKDMQRADKLERFEVMAVRRPEPPPFDSQNRRTLRADRRSRRRRR